MKAIKQTQTRDILDAYNREDISYSRMNEMFNELADEYAIEFANWTHNLRNECEKDSTECNKWKNISNKELLEIYKKEKGL